MTTWVEIFNIDEDVVVAWTKENCPSFRSLVIYDQSRIVMDVEEYRYEFEFYNEQDATMFLMRWS